MKSKIVLFVLAGLLILPACSKRNYKKKSKRYKMHLNDHPDRNKETMKHMNKKKKKN